jgi:hypothetical protein
MKKESERNGLALIYYKIPALENRDSGKSTLKNVTLLGNDSVNTFQRK